MDLKEKDILSYLKVKEKQKKDINIIRGEIRKKMGKGITGISTLCYMFIYAGIFFFSQYGIIMFYKQYSLDSPIFLLICLWVLYVFLLFID